MTACTWPQRRSRLRSDRCRRRIAASDDHPLGSFPLRAPLANEISWWQVRLLAAATALGATLLGLSAVFG
jgi:hypothetical protein